jgi:hypothetical protein
VRGLLAVKAGWLQIVCVLLAAAALLAAGLGADGWLVTVIGLVCVLLVATDSIRTRQALDSPTELLGTMALARVGLAGGAVAVAVGAGEGPRALVVWVATALLVLVTVEQAVAPMWRAAGSLVAGLPTFTGRRRYLSAAAWLPFTSGFLLALAPLAAHRTWLAVVLLVATLALALVLMTSSVRAIRDRERHWEAVRTALEQYDAPIMCYLTGPKGTEYQLGVWLSELERLDERVVIVVRENALARAVARMTRLAVVGAPTIANLESVHVSSFRVALYVNNGAKNGHNIRYRELTHVQLLHGDSDKPSSYNPVTGMFDKIFVAGQAGIDRYAAHGVTIPREKFVIVGRPQVSAIEESTGARTPFTVLYAPTWTGFNQDNNFGSLAWGPDIVRALVARGWRVVFRPHPYSTTEPSSKAQIEEIERVLQEDTATSGREHLSGDRASKELSIVDCFNLSDALVSDVSSVPADYLFSAKPFVITQVDDTAPEDFAEEFPLVRAAYVARLHESGSLERALDGLVDDALHESRAATRLYYLGDIPRATYADTFRSAVSALVAATPRVDGVHSPSDGDTVDV